MITPNDILKIRYDVDAYDFQSGVKEIRWQIRNSREHGKVYDAGILTARSHMVCPF